jgi:4-diphosphocytidyl-2-C-methyl-D-erythritol kinase
MTVASGPWPAPAKLNLMLRIVGRRPDGYHELQTVFQFLDIADHLYFCVTADGKIDRLYGPPEVPPEQDLVLKAARLLQTATGTRVGASIGLQKRLPIGGGLGGGSSNAATTLAVLNQLWGVDLTADELARLGLRLGADVPVFLSGAAAWAEGVGEILQPLQLPEPWYVVVKPNCQVSTAKVFQDPELTRNSNRIKIRDFLAGQDANDCLATVLGGYPPVKAAYERLGRLGRARLTGTGACVFAAAASQSEAVAMLDALASEFTGFVAKGRNRSPLQQCLGEAQEWGDRP